MSRMSTRRYKEKKTDKVYFVMVAVLVIAMIACWAVVWSKCNQYEKGSTKFQMNKVVDQLKKEFGGEITYKRAKTTDLGIDYNVYKDGELFATASLVEREEKAILGFSLYDIGDIKGSKSLSFLALPDAKVSVGGMKVSEMSVSESGIYLPGLKALANHKTNKTCQVPQYNEYVVENQFTVPAIEGEGLVLLDTNKGTLVAHEMPAKLQEELKAWTKDFLVKYTDYVVYGKGFDKIKTML
ncbi:MAG: hypothetical protein MJ150_03545 [Clostridia bacterium]|nr:hypothetical protein [Clostridia bacterium]